MGLARSFFHPYLLLQLIYIEGAAFSATAAARGTEKRSVSYTAQVEQRTGKQQGNDDGFNHNPKVDGFPGIS